MTQQESDLPIELAKPAQRALSEAGYLRLEQLTKVSETELKQLCWLLGTSILKIGISNGYPK